MARNAPASAPTRRQAARRRGHDVIAVGASAGGIDAISQVLGGLPADLKASIFVVVHIPPRGPSLLPNILQRRCALQVAAASDGAQIQLGHVYVAPPDCHLLVEPTRIRVVHGPKENRHRPAVDPLFRSAAWSHGPHAVGVVLSGALDDGAAGLWAVKALGGVTVVQEPADALYPDMPLAALANMKIDHRLPAGQISPLLVKLAKQRVNGHRSADAAGIKVEMDFASLDRGLEDMKTLGEPSVYSCPTCRGVLWEVKDGCLPRYRCHVGHAFTAESLVAEQDAAVEDALYSALRALEQKAEAMKNLADRMSTRSKAFGTRYEDEARALNGQATLIRDLLVQHKQRTSETER